MIDVYSAGGRPRTAELHRRRCRPEHQPRRAGVQLGDRHGVRARGGPTWTNYPTSINDVLDARSLAHDPLNELLIPGIAFPRPGVYGISVAGMVHNDDEQLGELNKLLSRGMSGLMHVEAVTVK